MLNDIIKKRYQQAKEFTKKHPTLVACGVTAVATYGFTLKYAVKEMQTDFNPAVKELSRLRGEFEQLYNESDNVFSFLDAEGLREKYFDWVKDSGEDIGAVLHLSGEQAKALLENPNARVIFETPRQAVEVVVDAA